MRKLPYNLTQCEKTRCPICNEPVDLLSTDALQKPIFYICWIDKHISEAGVGPVLRSDNGKAS
jgi:hypothetical protein